MGLIPRDTLEQKKYHSFIRKKKALKDKVGKYHKLSLFVTLR